LTCLELRGEGETVWGRRVGGRNDPMYAHVSKRIKNVLKKENVNANLCTFPHASLLFYI
jgi:hypothetical protein